MAGTGELDPKELMNSMNKRGWTPEHIRLGVAANRVSRHLLDLANTTMVTEANPVLKKILIGLACDLRRGFRPRRRIVERAA